MPKVSVIIATHSRPHLLPRAVKSAFAAGADVEVVVVDDASIDTTAEVCQKLKGIKYVRVERNQRTAGARNIGILNAASPYIAFLDDDDWRLPNSLDAQVKILDEQPQIGLVYGQYLSADQEGNLADDAAIPDFFPQGDVFWKILSGNFVGCLTAVFRKSCVSQIGLLDQTIPGVDDLDMWIRIAELYEFAAVEKPVAVWRKATTASGQGSSNLVKLLSQSVATFERKWSQLPRAKADPKQLAKARQSFTESTMNHMLYDAAHTKLFSAAALKFYQSLSQQPAHLSRLVTYKTIVRNLLERTKILKNKNLKPN